MKLHPFILVITMVLSSGETWGVENDRDVPAEACAARVLATPTYGFAPLRQIESGLFGGQSLAVRSTFASFFARTIVAKKRLPTEREIVTFISGALRRKGQHQREQVAQAYPLADFLTHMHPELLDDSADPAAGVLAAFAAQPAELRKSLQEEYDAHLAEHVREIEALELDPQVEVYLHNPAAVVGPHGLFTSRADLVAMLRRDFPVAYASVARVIWSQAFLFVRHRLLPPTFDQLASVLQFEDQDLLKAFVEAPGFWGEGQKSDVGRHLFYARKRIVAAFARAVRESDTALANRTRKIRPTLRRLVEVLVLTKSNEHYQWRAINGDYGQFEVFKNGKLNKTELERQLDKLTDELEALLGLREMAAPGWVFPMPNLFAKRAAGDDAWTELLKTARAEYQPTFTSYSDLERYPRAYAKTVLDKIVKAPGILVSSFTPGWAIDYDLLHVMLTQAKELNYEVVLIPVTGSTQDLDPRLLATPGVNILTASFENREFLLSHFPVGHAAQPITQFAKEGMFRVGQQIVLGSHVMDAFTIPTADNESNQTQIHTTGTINLPAVPANGRAQIAKAMTLSQQMKLGYTVAEKVDRGPEGDEGGVTNHWHIRPVEWKPVARGELKGGVAVDAGHVYEIKYTSHGQRRLNQSKSKWVSLVLPDVHFIVANPRVMMAIHEFITRMAVDGYQVELILPDPIDSRAINHHVELKQQADRHLNAMLKNGELDFEREIGDAIGQVNALLAAFPNVMVTFQYSNHSDEWIEKNMMNAPRWLQLIANGPLIDELRFACRRRKWTPLEYLLVYREQFLRNVHDNGSESYKDQPVFVSDPSRVRASRRNDKMRFGGTDPDWAVRVDSHGHIGANGARGSDRTHILSNERAITGDSHRGRYRGVGRNFWVSVGATALGQDYTRSNGYSSWTVTLAAVWDTNTLQAFNWDPNTGSFLQRSEYGVLPGERFFGEDPLRIVGAMDDDDRRREIDTQEFVRWFATLSNLADPELLSGLKDSRGRVQRDHSATPSDESSGR